MAEQPKQPKKPQRSRAKKITLNTNKRWKDILSGVDTKDVPITILQEIIVKLIDGTSISIDVKKLINDGIEPTEIEEMLDLKFDELDSYIENVDFMIDLDRVISVIQPETDKVLKNL